MVSNYGQPPHASAGIDRMKLRIGVLGILVIVAFVALFSRLWFLQVLASEEYEELAQENRVRYVYSEPSRGRILDRHGKVLVRNRFSLSATINKQIVDEPRERRVVLRRLSKVLDVPVRDLRRRLDDVTVSPYKPVAVANDISENDATYLSIHQERFPGVATELLPVRHYPHRDTAAHVLGYVGEISPDELKQDHFKGARPSYGPGDLVGKEGVEYYYDRFLRGKPQIEKVIVNSSSDVVTTEIQQVEDPGLDLVLSLDLGIQKVTEKALLAGLRAARGADYAAPAGAVVVMDPTDGAVIAMASYPDYDPSILADGLTNKEYAFLGARTPDDPDDDALLNRAVQITRPPGSTFKVVTAGAALATGIAETYSRFECAGAAVYPPQGGSGSVTFHNWTSAYRGYIGFPESLEHSCNTFYYELGWRMEDAFGASNGDGSERFQKYARRAGLGHETGLDVRYEADGVVPDLAWLEDYCEGIESAGCDLGWLPGYTVNMSTGQGDMIVTPLQMAVTYGAIANGGHVMRPRLGWELTTPLDDGASASIRTFKRNVVTELPLEDAEIAAIRQGLQAVVTGSQGTAVSAFSGFPLDRFPIAGKTGTAQLDEATDKNDAWFISYGPVGQPRYVVAVLVQEAGHGGTSAAPIARQVWEGIFGVDNKTDVRLGVDASG
ncbi:MAG TPA: penicillin-binding protein 2 [Actinomycetota bacterium]|nr:penicillin-binding protein 2 [Actinomycetota bacterium]